MLTRRDLRTNDRMRFTCAPHASNPAVPAEPRTVRAAYRAHPVALFALLLTLSLVGMAFLAGVVTP